MTPDTSESNLLEVLAKFDATPWEAACCAHQDSFELFTLTVRQQARDELEMMLPQLGAMPFSEVNRMIVVLGFGAVREGARGLASVTNSANPASLTQVGYDPLWLALSELANPLSSQLPALRQFLEGLPAIDAVIASAEQNLRERLMALVPELAAHDEVLRHVLLANLLHGVRCEYLYPRLAAQVG